jgi:hypothetical protein
MDTKRINNGQRVENTQEENKRKDANKMNVGAGVAMGVGGMAAGAAVVGAADAFAKDNDEETIVLNEVDEENEQTSPKENDTTQDEAVVNSKESDKEDNTVENQPNHVDNNTQHHQQTTPPSSNEEINPDEILAVTEVDTNDIDGERVINFDEVSTIVNTEGDEMNVGIFHTPDGTEVAMVDIDNDNVFDVVIDGQGDIIGDAKNMTVGDAELMINESNDTYLTQNDHESDSMTGESFTDDAMFV